MLKPRIVQILLYSSQEKVSFTCLILVPIYSQVRLIGLTTLRIFGKANSRNMMLWTGDEVRKRYSKAKTILVLTVSWMFLFCGFLPPNCLNLLYKWRNVTHQ